MELHLIRHGPKNNNPEAHGTGVEALLDPAGIPRIQEYARKLLSEHPEYRFYIETTPVERARATGQIIAEEISARSPRTCIERAVNELIGSYAQHPETGKTVNLSPSAMSKIWAEAKKSERYGHLQGEHKPLYAWCEQGFDNVQSGNPEDPGISLREIACRIGTYVHHRLPQLHEGDLVLAIGHSGDLEPFLYLTLEMLRMLTEPTREREDALVQQFNQTGGALEPLQGTTIKTYHSDQCFLTYPELHFGAVQQSVTGIPGTLFRAQAEWLAQHGKSRDVSEQKVKGITVPF